MAHVAARIVLAMGAVAAVTLPTAATAEVVVRFIAPDRFTDAQNRFGSGLSLRVTLAEVGRIMERYGREALRPGETLTVDVLDIDLAGFEQPGANIPYGLRVVRDITPPRFGLRYVLSHGKRRILSGEEVVTDQSFLMRSSRLSQGSFSHERELLRDWFRIRIAERRPQRN
ncbi:DUF3016 domain-containing protein [Methylobacterium sp. Leaf108]|uniref:DUF3016 domain-containing protein n=1 Tax=Methylobacterium sp. Leaf108 TaxID=1736256 RepID=UPI0006F581C0|nr:DUF3016 domain-containing protein [Methylobacterium sp. Leaf108]KQP50207.1 hypothetical protein ASF39_12835 [Methylobacterium sp. Leaf108]